MNRGMISKRYAKALLQFAVDQKSEDKVFEETKKIASAFEDEPRLRMAMDNPMVTTTEKLNLVEATVGGSMSDVLKRFVDLVFKNKRAAHLHVMMLGYQDMYCEKKDLHLGQLVTATPVDKAVVEKLKKILEKVKTGSIDLETSVDPSIDGGFVLYLDTYRYDASIASQLKRIKADFVAEATQSV